MRRRQVVMMVGGAAALGGCGGGDKPPPPPPPTTFSLELKAAAEVNPDGTGAPGPLRVRVVQLSDTGSLSQSDFFTLDADPGKTLGTSLLGTDDIVLRPGQTLTVTPDAKSGVKFIGVIGAYYAIEKSRWRAWLPVKPNAANKLVAQFNADAVSLNERSA